MNLQVFRALPRPLIQWVVIFMLFPFPALLGVVDSVFPGVGLRVMDTVLHWLNGLPESVYGFMGAIVVGGQVTRSLDKRSEVKAAETLVEARRIAQDEEVP